MSPLLVLLGLAFAGVPGSAPVPMAGPTGGSTARTERAVETPDGQSKPVRRRLPQNPYAETDYTAYTLEWGEVRLGVGAVAVGILPRVQVGTVPVLDALGVPNGQVKVDLLRVGPLDIGGAGGHYRYDQSEFRARVSHIDGRASLRMLAPWSLHGSVLYVDAQAEGLPTAKELPAVVQRALQVDDANPTTGELPVAPQGRGRVVAFGVASDVRLSRRDSFVARFGAVAWATGSFDAGWTGEQDPPWPTSVAGTTRWPLASTYTLTLCYQVSFRTLRLRAGGGISPVPMLWALRSFDAELRLGGGTRREERRARRDWRARDAAGPDVEGSVVDGGPWGEDASSSSD